MNTGKDELNPPSDSQRKPNGIQMRSSLTWLILVALVGLFLYTMLYRLDQYPSPWYDEGAFLKVSKNLALNGVYADYSSEGNRYLGPIVSTGPAVLVPIAFLFKVFGVSILLPRLFVVAFGILLIVALYTLTAHIFSVKAAVVAGLLVAFSTGVDLQFLSRTVEGEVPAVVFLLAALILWLKPARPRIWQLILVGILFGLASSTKFQYGIFILPCLLLAWIANIFWYRQRKWPFFVIPGIVAGLVTFGWLFVVIVLLGGQGSASENWQAFRGAGGNALSFDPTNFKQVIDFLLSTNVYAGFFFFGLIYAVFTSLGRSIQHQNRSILALLALGGTGMYALSIADWTRYALPALVLASVFIAYFFDRLTEGSTVRQMLPTRSSDGWQFTTTQLASWFFAFFLVVAVGYGAFEQFNKARHQGDYASAYTLADYIKTEIPPDALIETWEKELSILTDDNFHYPPQSVEIALGTDKWRGGQSVSELYDFRDYGNPDYVILGPFSKWAGIYGSDQLENYEMVKAIGPYEVYKRIS